MFKLTLGGRLEDWRASDGYNVNTDRAELGDEFLPTETF